MAKPKKLTNKEAIQMVEHHFGQLYHRLRMAEEIIADFIEFKDDVDGFTEYRKKLALKIQADKEAEEARQGKKVKAVKGNGKKKVTKSSSSTVSAS